MDRLQLQLDSRRSNPDALPRALSYHQHCALLGMNGDTTCKQVLRSDVAPLSTAATCCGQLMTAVCMLLWFQRGSVPHAPGGASGSPRLAAPVVGSQPPAGGDGDGAGARWMTCPAVLVRRSWCNLDSVSGPAAAAGGGGCLVCAMRVRCAASRSGTVIAGSGTLNPKAELRDVGSQHGALTNV